MNMSSQFPGTPVDAAEYPSVTNQSMSEESNHHPHQPPRQCDHQSDAAIISSTTNNFTSPQYFWNENDTTKALTVLSQLGLLVLAHIAQQPNQHQQQNTHPETHLPSTNQNLLQSNNNNNNNNPDVNLYATLLTQVARLYQTNLETTQHNHSTSMISHHSATTPKNNGPINIDDASASSNKTNDNSNIHNIDDASSKVLFLEQDIQELSPYQCLVRKQIEVFQHPQSNSHHLHSDGITQGRVRPIVPGQVGIRCRHCGTAKPHDRARYAILFPSRLIGVYQAAQNMANTHLLQTCKMIPRDIREELIQVRSRDKGKKTRKSSYGGGRQYWADCLRVLDVMETEDGRLRFATNASYSPPF